MLQDWQHYKEDSILNQELFVNKLYNAGVHLNLGGEICASWPLILILVKSNKAGLEQSGAFGKEKEAVSNAVYTNTIINASTITSAAIPPKVGFFGNTLCDNLQSANEDALVLSLLSKSVSGNEISSGKADLSALYMIPKSVFVKEVNDDNHDTNFEPASCVRVVSAGNNQTHQSVISRNIAGPPGK